MFADYKVGVWNRGPSTKVGGITIPGVLAWVRDVMCDIQPYSTALLLRTYGYNIEVNKRVFLDFDPDVKIGTVFYYTNPQGVLEKYEIKTLVNWDYLDCACLGVS